MSDSPPPTGCDDSDNNEEQDESGSEGASDTQDNGEASSVQGGLPLSKRQMKKQQKKQWLREQRKGKRKLERERRKEKRRIARENGEDLSADAPSRKKLREQTMASSSCRIRIAVDMSFDHLMSERDLRKSLSQLNFCYATNRRCANPVQFFVTNFNGPSRKIFDTIETNKRWDVNLCVEDYLTKFDKSEVVYLTSESENVIETLTEDKVYVIGGLIDHNSQKGLCHRLAVEKGVAHGRLPIDEYVQMKTRQVLTINQVFDILARFTESANWKDAFFSAIPKRKGVVEKDGVEKDGAEKDGAEKDGAEKALDHTDPSQTSREASTTNRPCPVVDPVGTASSIDPLPA